MLVSILGRNFSWRLGRAIYMAARGEGQNSLSVNSERMVIDRVAGICASESRSAIIFDCGANLGLWTEIARNSFKTRRVDARFELFEPAPVSCSELTKVTASFADTTVHNIALSNSNGEAAFHLVSPTAGVNSLVAGNGKANEVVQVKTERGTDFAERQQFGHITLLKIDTEGHDFDVLLGFEPMLIEKMIDVIQFEYNHRWLVSGRSMKHIFMLAERIGYRVGRASNGTIETYVDWNPEIDRFIEWNYLLISPNMIEAMGCRDVHWTEANTLAFS